MDEERKTARGESDAAEWIDGAAASSCGERKTAGELAGGGEASGAARPSTARSASPLPSPSPTPTFSGTNRPARRARRLRWQAGVPASMTALALFPSRCLSAVWRGTFQPSPACCTSRRFLRLCLWDLRLRRPTTPRNLASSRPMGLPAMLGPLTNKRLLNRTLFRQRWGLARSVACWVRGRLLRVRRPAWLTRRLRRPWRLRRPLRPAPLRMRDRIPAAPLRPGRGRARARLTAIRRREAPLQVALRPAGRRKRLRPRVLLKQKKLGSTRCWLII